MVESIAAERPGKPLKLGVIEGFYGRRWGTATRLLMMDWLSNLDFDAYLYAPKSDACLRKQWRAEWPTDEQAHLIQVARRCERQGLAFYLGLSPFELYADYDGPSRAALLEKVRSIVDIGVGGLAILFDDMPGGPADLAQRQAEICRDVQHCLGSLPLLVCPTYYSDDPVLDKFFGVRPSDYLAVLGRELPEEIACFWTGRKVVPERVAAIDLQKPADLLRRKLALWDNYPVNDSKTRSEHLYLQDLQGRESGIANHLNSHWCNAMNQAALSLPALASLPALYGRQSPDREKVFAAAGVDIDVQRACHVLASKNLQQLEPANRAALEKLVQKPTTASEELRAWISGEYQFDPACLTD